MTKLSHADARLTLAKQRRMTSLLDKEIAAESADMTFSKTDWVPLYFDRGNKVISDCGQIWAFRALTLKGEFLWLVFANDKVRGYHALTADPHTAIDLAKASWAHRRAVRRDWDIVERAARELLLGRLRFDVRIEDLHASPLCHLGGEGFRRAIGMGRINRMPGWLAALAMKIEPQMGFVIHAALQRHALLKDQDLPLAQRMAV